MRQKGVRQKRQQQLETGDTPPNVAADPEGARFRKAAMRLPGRASRHPAAVVGIEGHSLRDALADEGEEIAVFCELLFVIIRTALNARKHLARVAAVEAMLQKDIGQERDAAME